MRRQRLSFLLLAMLMIVSNNTFCRWFVKGWFNKDPNHDQRAAIPTDAESVLARGDKLKIACADMVDLELLPGVSDTLARNILEARTHLLITTHVQQSSETLLERVPGIGEKKAKELARYIDLNPQCTVPHSP